MAEIDEFALNANLIQRMNIGDTLTRTASRTPNQLAIIEGDRRISYIELNRRVNAMAHALLDSGYRRGDALALMAGNCTEFLITYFACAKIGLICVPLNLGWKEPEIVYVLDHSKAVAIVVEAHLVAQLGPALSESPGIKRVIVTPGLTGSYVREDDGRDWTELDQFTDGFDTSEPEVFVADRDPVSYLYTSGTTSAPKCVSSSHLSVYVESLTVDVEMGYVSSDKSAAMMPLFHTAQLNGFITPLVIVGATVVLMRGFDPDQLLNLIEQESITHIFGLPMMYRALLARSDIRERKLGSLRRAVYAMAPMPDADLRAAIEIFGCGFSLAFGQTEMAPVTTIFRPEHQLSHAGSVGTPAVNVQVEIMDDDGKILGPGESGEVVYRSPQTMEGYNRNEEATRAAFAYGWFHSGDIGHFDTEGFLWFEDRKKDIIKTGGENVASIEVEKAIYDVADEVNEVVVIGLPHPRWGEAITAVVTSRPGAQLDRDVVLAKAKQRLSSFKAPKAVVLIDELPRTSTGKVQKNVLRERLSDLYSDEA